MAHAELMVHLWDIAQAFHVTSKRKKQNLGQEGRDWFQYSWSGHAPLIWQWLVFEITLSLAALCGMQGLSSRLMYPSESGGSTSRDRHALPSPHVSNHSSQQLGQPTTGHRADALREGGGSCCGLEHPLDTRKHQGNLSYSWGSVALGGERTGERAGNGSA